MSLSFTDCGLTDNDIKNIIRPLKYSSLVQLDLSNNNISDKGAILLTKVIKENNILTALSLRNNFISEKGARAFLDSLKKRNYAITSIDLDGNASTISEDVLLDIQTIIDKNLIKQKEAFFSVADLANLKAPLRAVRIDIVGEAKSGKSSLLRSLLNENYIATHSLSSGISSVSVKARIGGSPWIKHGSEPLNGYCPDFIARLANIQLERNLKLGVLDAPKPNSLVNPFKRKKKKLQLDELYATMDNDNEEADSEHTLIFSDTEKEKYFQPEVMARA